jgi:hypothetical protein
MTTNEWTIDERVTYRFGVQRRCGDVHSTWDAPTDRDWPHIVKLIPPQYLPTPTSPGAGEPIGYIAKYKTGGPVWDNADPERASTVIWKENDGSLFPVFDAPPSPSRGAAEWLRDHCGEWYLYGVHQGVGKPPCFAAYEHGEDKPKSKQHPTPYEALVDLAEQKGWTPSAATGEQSKIDELALKLGNALLDLGKVRAALSDEQEHRGRLEREKDTALSRAEAAEAELSAARGALKEASSACCQLFVMGCATQDELDEQREEADIMRSAELAGTTLSELCRRFMHERDAAESRLRLLDVFVAAFDAVTPEAWALGGRLVAECYKARYALSPSAPPAEPRDPDKWLTVIVREGSPEVLEWSDYIDAVGYWDEAGAQWSEAWVCRVVCPTATERAEAQQSRCAARAVAPTPSTHGNAEGEPPHMRCEGCDAAGESGDPGWRYNTVDDCWTCPKCAAELDAEVKQPPAKGCEPTAMFNTYKPMTDEWLDELQSQLRAYMGDTTKDYIWESLDAGTTQALIDAARKGVDTPAPAAEEMQTIEGWVYPACLRDKDPLLIAVYPFRQSSGQLPVTLTVRALSAAEKVVSDESKV